MDHNVTNFLNIPSPSEWLSKQLKERGITQKQLANLLDIDGSQLNRIINKNEKISETHIVHACRIFGLSDLDTGVVLAQMNVHVAYRELDQATSRHCDKHPLENLGGMLNQIQDHLIQVAYGLYQQSFLIGEELRLHRLAHFLRDADYLIKLLIRTYLGEEGVLISPGNTNYHLRQPFSSYVGAIIQAASANDSSQLDNLRGLILDDFRGIVIKPHEAKNNVDYAQHHALHMLSRYGEDSDRDTIRKYLRVDDILARRMALFGMSLGGDKDVDQQLFKLVQEDPYFFQAVASFDGAHYGDVGFVDGRLPQEVGQLNVTIGNSLAYITQEVHSENLDLNFIKLTAFLRNFGPTIFTHLHLTAIKEILRVMSEAKSLSLPRMEFQNYFQQLINSQQK